MGVEHNLSENCGAGVRTNFGVGYLYLKEDWEKLLN
jgi:hypothetical protein